MAGSTWAVLPHMSSAVPPLIAAAAGRGAAIDYLNDLGMDSVAAHEHELTSYALEKLQQIETLRIIGPTSTEARGGAISFALEGIHPHDVGQLLDEKGIAVRVGHHCARPACLRYGVPATTRASVHLYTATADIDALVEGLDQVRGFFQR
jgi:cysteine desulfurase/selenocysteine lyase